MKYLLVACAGALSTVAMGKTSLRSNLAVNDGVVSPTTEVRLQALEHAVFGGAKETKAAQEHVPLAKVPAQAAQETENAKAAQEEGTSKEGDGRQECTVVVRIESRRRSKRRRCWR